MEKPEIKILGVKDELFQITDGKQIRAVKRSTIQTIINKGLADIKVQKYNCVGKTRDKQGRIVGYTLIDKDGNKTNVDALTLKKAIYYFKADCVNLLLTQDNRLISIDPKKETTQNENENKVPQQQIKRAQKIRSSIIKNYRDLYIDSGTIAHIFKAMNNLARNHNLNSIYLKISGKNLQEQDQYKQISNTKLQFRTTIQNGVLCVHIKPSENDAHITIPEKADSLFVNQYTIHNTEENKETYAVIQKLELDGLKWSKTNQADCMFFCTRIRNLVIKNSCADLLISMRQFLQYQSVETVDFQTFIVKNVKQAQRMFYGCLQLDPQKLDIQGLRFDSLKLAGQMVFIPYRIPNFSNASNLLILPDISDYEYTSLQDAILHSSHKVRLYDLKIEKEFEGQNRSKSDLDILVDKCIKQGWKGYGYGIPDDIAQGSFQRLNISRNARKEDNINSYEIRRLLNQTQHKGIVGRATIWKLQFADMNDGNCYAPLFGNFRLSDFAAIKTILG